jgi:Ca2+-binding RTX toxin-like protein
MTLHQITTNQNSTLLINTADDTWTVEEGVSLSNATMALQFGQNSSGSRLIFDGEITSNSYYGLYEGVGENVEIIVGKSGVLNAFISVCLGGEGSTATNYGTVSSAQANAMGAYLAGNDESFVNYGSITMTGTGTASAIDIATTQHVLAENHGTISSSVYGVQVQCGNAEIDNFADGSISGTKAAVALGVIGQAEWKTVLVNSGDITSSHDAVEGSKGMDVVTNKGDITGLITLDAGDDRLVNMGTIKGDIFLGDGDDYFSNKGGDWQPVGMLDTGAGADTIDLRGGTMADSQGGTPQIWGADGNDTYIVDSTGFDLRENVNGGVDTVKSTVSLRLTANFEDLVLLGTKDLTGTGNAADNHITGNSGNNVLSGMGGEDIIDGGAGEDTLAFDPSGDKGVSANLPTGKATGADDLTSILFNIEDLHGTGFFDILIGGAGRNTIEGGAGGDLLTGNGGRDTLSYQHSTASVDVDFKAGTYHGGDAEGDIVLGFENLLGSRHADTLAGSDGANRMEGGRGNDILTGYGGKDVFVFSARTGHDTITDFSGHDHIDVSAGMGLFKDFADLMDHVTTDGDSVLIHHGKDVLILDHTAPADLHASDFIF